MVVGWVGGVGGGACSCVQAGEYFALLARCAPSHAPMFPWRLLCPLQGMAERGFLPGAFYRRSRYGTPTLGIVCSSVGVLAMAR